jgi:hypothetical protein
MGDYSKYKNVNTVFGGAGGIVIPTGATADRDAGVVVGTLRYNTDLGLVEQYNALGWQSVDAPPAVTSISGTINENTNSNITITGTNFKTGAIVYVEGTAVGGIPRALSTTFVSVGSLQAASNAAAVNYVGAALFDIKVVNPSGLSGTLTNAGTIDRDPVWSTPTGTYTVFDGSRGQTLTFSAADPDGGTITYSLASGSLPTGASLNTSTGAISGFSAVGSDVSSTFTLRATSSVGSQAADRSFTILVRAPQTVTFTYTGADQAWTVPTGATGFTAKMWGGGGGGGGVSGWAGGGNAGGGGYATGFVSTNAGTTYRIVVGSRGFNRGPGATYGGGGGTPNTWGPGSGAGLTGIFNNGAAEMFSGATPTGAQNRSVLIAGGGGGGGANRNPGSTNGGPGGGTNGIRGNANYTNNWGNGGTQNAAGTGNGGTGGALRGSNCNVSYGAGGGGGYFGGGAGFYQEPQDMGGGGGGSGFGGGATSVTLTEGSGTTPGNSGDGDRSSAGNGGAGDAQGTDGRLVIRF